MGRMLLLTGVLAFTAGVFAQQPPQGQPAQPAQQPGQGRGAGQAQPRDRAQVPPGTAAISGRVLTADTGRPVKRARVMVSGGGRGGRTAITDDQGRYRIVELAAGSYTVTGSKTGFVDGVFGQRRPLQPGTPIQLVDGQDASSVDLRLVRGGVITGRVLDEDGEALARALVTVQRYQYVRGERQLAPAGGDQTDDRGQYRVFGLPPGDYYVSASAGGLGQLIGRGLQQLAAGIAGGGRGGRGGPVDGGFAGFALNEPEATGYAPTYYPGVVSAPEAGKITVAPGQEVVGIDFQIQLVPFATVSGIVAGGDQAAAVMLMPQDTGGLGPLGGQVLAGRSQADGTFTIANVPPGRYVAVARSGGRGDDQRVGTQSVVVNGQNIGGLSLVLQGGVTIAGNITVESTGTPAPTDYSSFRIDAPDVTPLPLGPGGGRGGPAASGGRAEKNGAFEIPNLLPGKHFIRVGGGGPGAPGQAQGSWTMKSVNIGGQDVTDQPVDLKPGQNLDNVTIVLSDRSTEISGAVRDGKGTGMPGMTVIAFSSDPQYWRAQSRHIQAARTDQTGAYRIRNLPAGDYLIVAVDDVEQGEWFDPAYLEQARTAARHVSITEGEKKAQDLRAPGG
jgi:carboxypeptidase family protein